LDLLKDPRALEGLKKYSKKIGPTLPTEDEAMNARIKFQASLDSVLQAYQKIGRPGFCGNWTIFQKYNPDIMSSTEMEKILIALMNAFVKLSSLTADLLEVFRSFIHSDNVEKTYLIKYLRTFPKEDQKKLIRNVEVLNGRIREIHQVMSHVNSTTHRLTRLYCPPERPLPYPHEKVLHYN